MDTISAIEAAGAAGPIGCLPGVGGSACAVMHVGGSFGSLNDAPLGRATADKGKNGRRGYGCFGESSSRFGECVRLFKHAAEQVSRCGVCRSPSFDFVGKPIKREQSAAAPMHGSLIDSCCELAGRSGLQNAGVTRPGQCLIPSRRCCDVCCNDVTAEARRAPVKHAYQFDVIGDWTDGDGAAPS